MNCNMWVRTWSEILNDCRARLQLFEKELNYNADKDDSLAFLRATYARVLSVGGKSELDMNYEESSEGDTSDHSVSQAVDL
jgi:hypothetical protein